MSVTSLEVAHIAVQCVLGFLVGLLFSKAATNLLTQVVLGAVVAFLFVGLALFAVFSDGWAGQLTRIYERVVVFALEYPWAFGAIVLGTAAGLLSIGVSWGCAEREASTPTDLFVNSFEELRG